MHYLALMNDGSMQQTAEEPDQEDMQALDDGDIDHIIKFDQESGFCRAVVKTEEDQYSMTWEVIEEVGR